MKQDASSSGTSAKGRLCEQLWDLVRDGDMTPEQRDVLWTAVRVVKEAERIVGNGETWARTYAYKALVRAIPERFMRAPVDLDSPAYAEFSGEMA